MSLIATGLIIFVGSAVLSGVFVGVGQVVKDAKESKNTSAPITAKVVALSEEEKERAQAIMKQLRRTKDEVTGTTWLKPSWANRYANQIYLYVGLKQAEAPFLRLTIEYEGKEMLLIKRFVFRIDEKVETIEPSQMLKSDYVVDTYWEWFDELAEQYLDVIEKIAKGNKVLMRYDGRQYNKDTTVSPPEKKSLDQMLLVYRYLKEQGGQF